MHWTLTLIACLVVWAGIGGIWRKGSIALCVAWAFGQAIYIATGDSLPVEAYKQIDPIVALVIICFYGSKLDAAILVLFVPAWWAYDNLTGVEQWWTLLTITCAQLFLAGPIPNIQRILFTISHGPRRAEV